MTVREVYGTPRHRVPQDIGGGVGKLRPPIEGRAGSIKGDFHASGGG